MKNFVELSARELAVISAAARERVEEHRELRGPMCGKPRIFTAIQGLIGEVAFGKLMGLYVDLDALTLGHDVVLPHGLRVDVKTTRLESGMLLVPRYKLGNTTAHVFALAVIHRGTDPLRVSFPGWVTRDDLFCGGELRDFGHGPAYSYRQEHLTDIAHLSNYDEWCASLCESV